MGDDDAIVAVVVGVINGRLSKTVFFGMFFSYYMSVVVVRAYNGGTSLHFFFLLVNEC